MSREKKFTPGPWSIDYGGTIGHIKAIINDGKRYTPTVAEYDSSAVADKDEQQANANLIAAAPELLEALESIMSDKGYLDSGSLEDIHAAEDAIKKAYGETE